MKNILRAVFVVFSVVLFSISAFAQQSVSPPPKPANDAPANAAVLKLLQVGMPESVVLDRIHATIEKFDLSTDALVTLKQAGATEAELKAIVAQGTAPTAAPADTGPSLAESMRFIQDRLNELGKVTFVVFVHNTSADITGSTTERYEISNLVADQNQCRISYHWEDTSDANTPKAGDIEFSLRDVQEIVVKSQEQLRTEWNAKGGAPDNIITSTSPPATALQVQGPHGVVPYFPFTDAELADRVAKAMLHAVELCGGGNKDKF
jgi:hypothetical protein